MELLTILVLVYVSIFSILSTSVVFLNGLFLIAFLKKRSLHSPSNAVLLGLCCSDLLIGILSFVQWILLIFGIANTFNEQTYLFFFNSFFACTGISSLFMTLVNLDRYAAICHPFKYLQYATPKLYAVISISTCLASFVVISIVYALDKTYGKNNSIVLFVIIVATAKFMWIYFNWKIFQVIHRHRREIASVERLSSGQQNRFQADTKRYRIMVLLIILFVSCKLPPSIFYMLVVVRSIEITNSLFIASVVFDTLLLLNSLFNPLVYYFSASMFRTAMKSVLCCQRDI